MHPASSLSLQSRKRLWSCSVLIVVVVSWFVIQTALADSSDALVGMREIYAQGATPSPTPYPTPAQVGTLVPLAPANSDAYGSAVAVSGDTVVVGAPYRDHDGLTDAGTVYVYQWNGIIWALQAELTPSDAAASDQFGGSIGIYKDTIIVSAVGDDDGGDSSGSAYIFVRNGTTWSQQAKLISSDAAANDDFGNAVAISVDSVLIGASGDDQAAVGAGAAYVFTRSGIVWSVQQKLMAGDPVAGSMFGYAVDLYGDTAVIGAPRPDTLTGAAYVFVRAWGGTTWTQQQKLNPASSYLPQGDHFGAAVSVYNETIAVGAPELESNIGDNVDDGSVQVFTRVDETWTSPGYSYLPTAGPSALEPQHAAASVDVYREAVVVGVPGRWINTDQYPGGAYVGNWLLATPASNHALVGASIARDGITVVVGAPADDFFGTDTGAAYIFRVIAPPWQPTASVTPSLTPSNTPEPTNTPHTPTSPPDSTPVPHFFAIRRPTLTWSPTTWALGYQIEIDDDPTFASPITADTDAYTLTYITTSDFANGLYYWRVRAKQNDISWGDWSATETIIVSAP